MTPMRQFDQFGAARTFEQRLSDFPGELRTLLRKAWDGFVQHSINDYSAIYALYTGDVPDPSEYDPGQDEFELRSFLAWLRNVSVGWESEIQCYWPAIVSVNQVGDDEIRNDGHRIWKTFVHFFKNRVDNSRRLYIHATDVIPALALLDLILKEAPRTGGLDAVKIVAPGDIQRTDTLVAWFCDDPSRRALIDVLTRKANPGWFANALPQLVAPVAPGIGVADEPPSITLERGQGDSHSYGAFYSTLIWLALKQNPARKNDEVAKLHFLDNFVYCLRTLQIDPRRPERIPARHELEALQAKFPA